MKAKLNKVFEGTYVLEFFDKYDLCMTAWRYIMFFKTPRFENKPTTLVDFMEYHTKKNDTAEN